MSEAVPRPYALPHAAVHVATTRSILFAGLVVVVVGLLALETTVGTVPIPLGAVLALLAGDSPTPGWDAIVLQLRLPRALTAALAGAGLGVCGLMLQTLFRNPLAGPWALGVMAGAQVGVAVVVVSGALVGISAVTQLETFSQLSLVTGASLGAAGVMGIVIGLSRRVSSVTLLILGLMLGFMSQGVVSLVLHFTTESQAKLFGSWNDGHYGGVTWDQLRVLAPLVVGSLIGAIALAKSLNALLLGDHHAKALGVDVRLARFAVLTLVTLTAGGVTAYCGPIAFLDLVVPHLCRSTFRTSDHRLLIPAVILTGASVGMFADLIVNLPWERHFLHLNAVNGLIGGPVVFWVLLRHHRRFVGQ
jgi:iron complex transport system permease protein